MRRLIAPALATLLLALSFMHAQRYTGADGRLRVALVKQPFSPTGTSAGPNTMANGGIQQALASMGAVVRVEEAALTAEEATEYGGWKRLGMALGHFAGIVAKNERDGYFTVGLLTDLPIHAGIGAGAGRRVATFGADARAAQDRDALPSMRTRTSTRRRPRAAARSAACRWRSRRAGRCSGYAWTRASIRPSRIATS